ncbi:MAG TPA: 4Fe-4S binding protein [Candidatus Woesebacteria bacterium]|nr:4Fe-4S binding protein [Candidatus Woesebacteria bacterium]
MTHFITSKCNNCGQCQKVCAVECIVKGNSQSFIDPSTCIDCGACASECPYSAIQDKATPDTQIDFNKNAEFFSVGSGYKNQK